MLAIRLPTAVCHPPPGSKVVILVVLQEAYNLLVFAMGSKLEALLDDNGAVATFWFVAVVTFSAT